MAALLHKAVDTLSPFASSNPSADDPANVPPPPSQEPTSSLSPPGRPTLERLPSQAMSSASEDSNIPIGPNVEFNSPTPVSPDGDLPFGEKARRATIEQDRGHLSPTPKRGATSPSSLESDDRRRSSSASSPSTIDGYQAHRRSWSQSAPKTVKETLNAKTTEELETGVRTLNQYRLGEELGKGSFGVVWRATDVNTGIEYAVKEFSKARLRRQAAFATMRANRRKPPSARPTPLPSPNAMDRGQTTPNWRPRASSVDSMQLIRGEVAIMKKLRHVNIVSLHEVLDEGDTDSLYMILELCAGGPIMQVTVVESAEPMAEMKARGYFRQVLLALEYLHHLDICHHDIKPDNILLKRAKSSSGDDGDFVKLVDFGVSQLFARDGEDLSAKTVGSPAFLSPELHISHHGQLHQRASDIWSLGVTLYALLTGRLPFRSTNSLELAEMIKNEPAAIPRALSPEARDILCKMLDKCPDTRVSIPELRIHPWTTDHDENPLPSFEANIEPFDEPTQAELDDALRSLSSAASAVRIAQRLRRLAASRRSISHDSRSPGSTTTDDASTSSMTSSTTATSPHSSRTSAGSASEPPKAELGIIPHDDVNVETLRRYEDTTGEMLERNEVITRAASGTSRLGSGKSTPARLGSGSTTPAVP